jgi:hypothetical protein
MSTPPTAPGDSPRKERTTALLWTLSAVVVAVLAFVRAAEPGEKRNFYLIAGVVAVIAALWNGYGAWLASRPPKTPTT